MKIYFDGNKKIIVERFEESKTNSIFPRYLAFPKNFFPQAQNFKPIKVTYEIEFFIDSQYFGFHSFKEKELKKSKESEDILLFPLYEAIRDVINHLLYYYDDIEDYSQTNLSPEEIEENKEVNKRRAEKIAQAKKLRLKITSVICESVGLKELTTDFVINWQGKEKLST